MANVMNEIYQGVCSRLSNLTGGTIKWFDVQMNQTTKEVEKLPVDYPAVFFKHTDVIWDMNAPQMGVVAMEMKIIYPINDDENLFPPQPTGRGDVIRRNQDLELINGMIAGLSGPGFNKIKRLNSKEEFNSDLMAWQHTINYYTNILSDGSTPAGDLTIDFDYLKNLNELLKHNKCCK